MPGGGLAAEHVPWLLKAGVRQLHLGDQVRPGGSAKAYVDAGYVRSWRSMVDDVLEPSRLVDVASVGAPMILIDPPLVPSRGTTWSHLASDTSYDELHAFARALGIPERGFDRDHYDVPAERYDAVVAAGAVPVSSRELIVRLRDAGLRTAQAIAWRAEED